jgi:hypothetical protein
MDTITDATTANEFDILSDVPLSETLIVTNETPGVATLDSALRATRVSDGTASVILQTTKTKRRITYPVTQQGGQSTSTFSGDFVAGSLAKHLLDDITARIAGKTAPTFGSVASFTPVTASTTICDMFVGGVRNTGAWWGSVDLTSIAVDFTNGVLVTPRDMIFAAHFGANNPTFINAAGQSFNYTIASTTTIVNPAYPGGTDILVAKLNADVDASITPAKTLPANWATKLPNGTRGYVSVYSNQDRRLLIRDTTYTDLPWSMQPSSDATRATWQHGVRGGDSGSPFGIFVNGVFVVIGTFWFAGGGYQIADNITAINAAITAHGSPYALSAVNLSGFNSY